MAQIPATSYPSHSVLGMRVDSLTMQDLHDLIAASVAAGETRIIANHNLHSAYLFHRDAKMRSFYERASWVHVDGMPLVFLGRLLGLPLRREHRVTYSVWVRPLMSEAARCGWRVFFLGSRPGVAARAAQALRAELPSLQIETHDGYFDATPGSPENEALLARIRAYRPHVLMVGMGMPRQEHWILDHLERIQANAILTAGACMDYVAGAVPTPPAWMGRLGLEWLFRLASDPARLWKRYLVEPWFLTGLLCRQWLTRGQAVDGVR